MNIAPIRKHLLMSLIREARVSGIGCGLGSQLQQVRRHCPVSGPPRFRLSTAQKAIYGWGSLLLMMVIPYWSLYQMPRWSALHNNLPFGEDKEAPAEEESSD